MISLLIVFPVLLCSKSNVSRIFFTFSIFLAYTGVIFLLIVSPVFLRSESSVYIIFFTSSSFWKILSSRLFDSFSSLSLTASSIILKDCLCIPLLKMTWLWSPASVVTSAELSSTSSKVRSGSHSSSNSISCEPTTFTRQNQTVKTFVRFEKVNIGSYNFFFLSSICLTITMAGIWSFCHHDQTENKKLFI